MIRISLSQIPKHSPPSYVVAISSKCFYWETANVDLSRSHEILSPFFFSLRGLFCVCFEGNLIWPKILKLSFLMKCIIPCIITN